MQTAADLRFAATDGVFAATADSERDGSSGGTLPLLNQQFAMRHTPLRKA